MSINTEPAMRILVIDDSEDSRDLTEGALLSAGYSNILTAGSGWEALQILDVVVDIRRGSPTFGAWEAFELSDENMRIVYCPIGFAHGFCTVSDVADVIYKQSNYYDPEIDKAIKYDDPDVGIQWPSGLELTPSRRDASAPLLREIANELPFQYDAPA